MSDNPVKSVFCVINNPCFDIQYRYDETGKVKTDELGNKEILTSEPTEYNGMTEQEICDCVLKKWVDSKEERTGAVLYCISSDGLKHLHCVFESVKSFRPFATIKKLFPKVHIEITKGNKKQVEDYINKVGKFEEKGEKIIAKSQEGEIIGCQGKRSDLIKMDDIKLLIYEKGLTPNQIFVEYPQALKSQSSVIWLYQRYRFENTPPVRDVKVHWLFGSTGCGKSYTYIQLCKKYGEENVYLVSDYEHPFDFYNGEKIIFFDEFRGQIKYSVFLGITDKYKKQIDCRYQGKYMLWNEVYITSPCLPYELYRSVRDRNTEYDSLQQLVRRIDTLTYCFKVENGEETAYCKKDLDIDIDGDPVLYRSECSTIYNKFRYDIIDGLTFCEDCDIKFA